MDKSKNENIQRNDHGVTRIPTETPVAHQNRKVSNDILEMDITTVEDPNSLKVITIEKDNLGMIVDTFTGLKWIHLYAMKNGMVKLTCEFFKKWKDINTPVKIFISDKAG